MAPLINKEIDSFLGGVSQQPPETRLDSQVEESINSLLDTTSGAMKRPPLLHKATLNSTTMRETKTHIIDRDENETYIVNVEKGLSSAKTEMKILDAGTGDEQILGFLDKDGVRERTDMELVSWSGGGSTGNDISIEPNKDDSTTGITAGGTVTLNGTGYPQLDGVTFTIASITAAPLFSLANTQNVVQGPGTNSPTPLHGRITHVDGVEIPDNLLQTPAESYFSNIGTPNKSLRMLTIADTTFVVNRLKTVTMSGSPPVVPLDRAVISCSGGGVLNADSTNWRGTELVGYDADDPKTLEGPRWKVDIYQAAASIGPATLSNDVQSSRQIHRILKALSIWHNDTITAWNGGNGLGPPTTGGTPANNGDTQFFDHFPSQGAAPTGAGGDLSPNGGTGLVFMEAGGSVPENFSGRSGWSWEYPGGEYQYSKTGGTVTRVTTPNWILGTYDPGTAVNPFSTTSEISVTVPSRERIEFTEGSSTLTIIHNWNGPADVSKLPAKCADGFVTKIVGDAEVEADEYYLKFSEKDSAWIESLAESTTERTPLDSSFDGSTMPHVLKRRIATGTPADDHDFALSAGDIYFTFGPENWASRTVGDEVMSPEPSFVGQTLNDVVLYKDRLTLLSRDSAVFSEVREPLNFWPTSIMSFVDSDPIDVQAATTTDGVSNFHSGVATEAGLLLFTDSGQFLARSGVQDPFTSRTVHIDQISRYQSENISKPAFIGSRVYWVTEQGVNSKVWEYIVTSASGGGSFSGSATEVTGHVPRYLPRNIYKITGNDNENIVCFFSRDEPKNIYVYQYLFSGNNRLQSAWSKWTFDQEIVNGGFVDRNLHLLMDRTDGQHGPSTTLEYLPPRMSDPNITDSPIPSMPVFLDQRVQYTLPNTTNPSGLYSGQYKEIVLDYPVPRDPANSLLIHPAMEVLVGGSSDNAGSVTTAVPFLIVDNDPNATNSIFFVASDDIIGEPLFIGKKYNQEINFSRFVIKTTDRTTRAVKPYTSGRTQIRTFTLRFSQSGPFTIYVDNGGTPYTYNYYDPWVLNDPLGPGIGDESEFKIDVGGRNTETSLRVVNDSPFISNFIGARYEASWNTRSKRI